MAPRPSSPTSLLWAHQLKREHGHLLHRVQALEATSDRNQDRIKAAEEAATNVQSNGIAVLAKQVKALDEAGISKRIAKIERDVNHNFEDVQAESEAMVLKIAALERNGVKTEEEKKKAFSMEKAMLKRVAEIEGQLKKNEALLQEVRQEMRPEAYEGEIDDIRQMFAALTAHVESQGHEFEDVAKKVAALEAANDELRRINEFLGSQVDEVAMRPVSAPAKAMPKPPRDDGPKLEFTPASACLNCKAKHTKCDKGQPSCNNCVRSGAICCWNSEPTLEAKTQKSAKQSSSTFRKPPKIDRKVVAVPDQKQLKPVIAQAENPVIRAGKGWVEVARTPSAVSRPVPPPARESKPVKRHEGLRKNVPELRSQAESPANKRKIEVEIDAYTMRVTRSQAVPASKPGPAAASKTVGKLPKRVPKNGVKKALKKSQKGQANISGRSPQEAPGSNVFSSPVPSPAKARKRGPGDCGALLQQAVHRTEAPSVPVHRRQIIQEDESALLWQYGQ